MSTPRKKGKSNPEGNCFCCKEKIKNRSRQAEYCRKCARMRTIIHRLIGSTINNIKNRRYPDYAISITLNLKTTKEENHERNKTR